MEYSVLENEIQRLMRHAKYLGHQTSFESRDLTAGRASSLVCDFFSSL